MRVKSHSIFPNFYNTIQMYVQEFVEFILPKKNSYPKFVKRKKNKLWGIYKCKQPLKKHVRKFSRLPFLFFFFFPLRFFPDSCITFYTVDNLIVTFDVCIYETIWFFASMPFPTLMYIRFLYLEDNLLLGR